MFGSGALCKLAPQLWFPRVDTFDQATLASPLASDGLWIGSDEIRRYAAALIRFWGTADPLPMAIVDASFQR